MNYQIEPKAIVHETIDSEVVIVNFANGNYYSLIGVSAFIWEILLTGPKTDEEIHSALLRTYRVDDGTAKRDISIFLTSLITEGLIKKLELKENNLPTIHLEAVGKKSYHAPVIEIHSDMREVIVLDPVHEIDYADHKDPTN